MFSISLLSAEKSLSEEPKIPEILLKKVAEGDAETAYIIGMAFLNGHGDFEVDKEQAKIWMTKAAEMNYSHGMFELAMMLFIDRQYEMAYNWFENAAAQGHGESFYRLANYHVYGFDSYTADCDAAYNLYEEAQKRAVDVAFNDHAWMLSTWPEKRCRNGEKAWRIFSALESQIGSFEQLPINYVDTKAAVLAEISEFNEAILVQAYAVESACGVVYADYEDKEEWIKETAKQGPDFCKEGVRRLQNYMNRKPWREKPLSELVFQ